MLPPPPVRSADRILSRHYPLTFPRFWIYRTWSSVRSVSDMAGAAEGKLRLKLGVVGTAR